MQIRFANGTTLEALSINGENLFYQGASRDSLEIQLEKGKYTFDEVEMLTAHPENLRQLTILEDSGETVGVHEHYTLRAAIAVRTVETERTVTPDAPPAAEERLCVTLAQQTYLEQQLAVLRDTVDTLVLASLK